MRKRILHLSVSGAFVGSAQAVTVVAPHPVVVAPRPVVIARPAVVYAKPAAGYYSPKMAPTVTVVPRPPCDPKRDPACK